MSKSLKDRLMWVGYSQVDNCQKCELVIWFILCIVLFSKYILLSVNVILIGLWSGNPSSVTPHLCTRPCAEYCAKTIHLCQHCPHTEKTASVSPGLGASLGRWGTYIRENHRMCVNDHLENTLGKWSDIPVIPALGGGNKKADSNYIQVWG